MTTITWTAFEVNGPIPKRCTCDARCVPSNAKSLALIEDDPVAPEHAAPNMVWVHWALYNLPSNVAGLDEAVAADALPPGTCNGLNDWHRTGYGSPCPPIGRHRYFHKRYVLDAVLSDLGVHPTSNRWSRRWLTTSSRKRN